jgi:hypothetical protein
VTRAFHAAARTLALTAALLLAACDQDPFGLATRDVAGAYDLERFEDGSYFLVREGGDVAGGAIGGIVDRIGWNERYILASHRRTPGGAVDGWAIVDLRTDSIHRGLSAAQVAADARVRNIDPLPAAQAYDRIGPGAAPYLLAAAPLALVIGFVAVRGRRRQGSASHGTGGG